MRASVGGGTGGLKERRRKTRRKGGYQGVLNEERGMWVCEGLRRMSGLEWALLCVRIRGS